MKYVGVGLTPIDHFSRKRVTVFSATPLDKPKLSGTQNFLETSKKNNKKIFTSSFSYQIVQDQKISEIKDYNYRISAKIVSGALFC